MEALTLWFMEVPWLVAVVVLVLAFLLSMWMRQWLRGQGPVTSEDD